MDASPLFAFELGALGTGADNSFVFEGLNWKPGQDGAIEFTARKFQISGLRLACGSLVLEIGQLDLQELSGRLRTENGAPRLSIVKVAKAQVSNASMHGPLAVPSSLEGMGSALQRPGDALSDLCLSPLADAEGTLRLEITDAHLLFDADVTIPIQHGQIDFNDATVEHVGPDSRMGVSRMGIYVDAPNGRSYIYQFASPPVSGVDFEQRGALLSPWVSRRGKVWLQSFAEALVRQARGGLSQGLTEQARLLLQRSALSGHVRLSDGPIAVPGVHATMSGQSQGCNSVKLYSKAVGAGLTTEMDSLCVRDATLGLAGLDLSCDELKARIKLQLFAEDKPRMRFVLNIDNCLIAGPRLEIHR